MVASKDKGKETGAELAPRSLPGLAEEWSPQESWEEATAAADRMIGHDLAKDELLDALVGVPFLVTGLTFRRGYLRPDGRQFAYVSAEVVIADAPTLAKRRVKVDDLPFEPGGTVVFNDGSTGIYRQFVAYLADKGAITLPDPIIAEGTHGESSLDLPPNGWADITAGELTYEPDGWANYTVSLRLLAPRGLRLSEYTNDWAPNGAKTRYLA